MIDVASFSLPYADQMGDGKLRSWTWHQAQVWHINIPSDNHMHSEDLRRSGSAPESFHGDIYCKLKLLVKPKSQLQSLLLWGC